MGLQPSLRLLVLLSSVLFFSACAGNLHRPGYDRLSGSYKGSGKKNTTQPKAQKTSKNPTQQASQSAPRPTSGKVYYGTVSYYGPNFHGKPTASGERFNQNALTCAHKTFPFGTQLRVTLKSTGKSVTVRVNDRGPYAHGRILDLSLAAAKKIGLDKAGVGEASIQVLN